MPKVSVVVPTFNSAPFLGETLDSIGLQKGVDLEIIVVDDASTDDTAAVVADHSAPNLRYLLLPANHGGPSRPRNVGVAAAAGDYIAFFDSDDLMLPGHLARSLRFLADHPEAGLVFSRGLRWSEQGRLTPHLTENVYRRFSQIPRRAAGAGASMLEREAAFECLFFENYILPSGVMVPRKILDEIGPFDESLRNGDDRDLWFRLTRRYPIGFLDMYGFYYRVRGGSVSGRGAHLAENRIRVLRKQLAAPLPQAARRGARRLIARNLYGIGYMHQAKGEKSAARRTYLESLRAMINLPAARGLGLSLLPACLRQPLQASRQGRAKEVSTDGPLVSIVVTCFNYAHYLAGCLESILVQSYQNFEIILVNDGSTDDTDEVVVPFLADPRITYLRQENRGQAVAKNVGIARARGEFIAFLDADDRWEPEKLGRQIPLFANPDIGVVYSRARYVDAEGKGLDFRLSGKYLAPRAGGVTEHLFMDNFVPFSSSVVRRECFDRVGVFDESLAMGIDWDLWLRISVHYRFDFVDEPLLVYRQGHPGQMSRKMEVRQACSDRIMAGFLKSCPDFLNRRTVRRARAYTLRNRGYYFRETDFGRSFSFYLEAIKTAPLEISSYKGLGKSAILNLLRKTGLCRTKSKLPT